MVAQADDDNGGWTTWEVALPTAEEGKWRYPFSEAFLACTGDPVNVAIADMKLLQELGFPPRPVGRLQYSRTDKKAPKIYRLKCKPSCWRLYLYPHPDQLRLIYLHSVCKKRDEQDPKDARLARDRLERLFSGNARALRFAFPDP